jgi:hypothetical protein
LKPAAHPVICYQGMRLDQLENLKGRDGAKGKSGSKHAAVQFFFEFSLSVTFHTDHTD